jgi:hypothetical protein
MFGQAAVLSIVIGSFGLVTIAPAMAAADTDSHRSGLRALAPPFDAQPQSGHSPSPYRPDPQRGAYDPEPPGPASLPDRQALRPYGPDQCRSGFVWREAVPGDHVCVLPRVREMARADNGAARSHTLPDGKCHPGYEWRLVNPDDRVCVTPESHTQAHQDNGRAEDRVAP